MASNRGYTTSAIVRAALADRVDSTVTDAEIDDMISMNEGFVDSVLKIGSGGEINPTFSATTSKHVILRKLVTMMTVSDLIMTSSICFTILDHAILAQKTAIFWYTECLKFLADPKDTSRLDWMGE